MVINIAVVEDDSEQITLLSEYLHVLERDSRQFKIQCFSSAEDFLEVFRPGMFHILFQDIQLKKMDGLSCARMVRDQDRDVMIIFITSMAQFAVNGYEVEAKDYIVKPVLYDSFFRKMERILPQVKNPEKRMLSISSGSVPYIISVDNLRYVEVYDHKLIYHLTENHIETYGRIGDVEETLKPFQFIRINRNAVINPRFIDLVDNNNVQIGEDVLTVSSSRKKDFLRELNLYLAR